MIHNHVLDVLRGRVSPPDVVITHRMDRTAIARMVRDAEVFDFGEMDLEDSGARSKIDGSVIWVCPALTKDEQEFWRDGYIPLPAPFCWYEFKLSGYSSALLVDNSGKDGMRVMRFDLEKFDGDPAKMSGVFIGVWTYSSDGNGVVVDIGQAPPQLRKFYHDNPMEAQSEASNFRVMQYMTLMINSKSTTRVPHPRTLQTQRLPGNRHAPPAHTVVTIIPAHVRARADHEAASTGTPRRLHWRRSHLREYKAPSGEVYHKVVVPRHLVGKAEVGTVTHTYKVNPPKKPKGTKS